MLPDISKLHNQKDQRRRHTERVYQTILGRIAEQIEMTNRESKANYLYYKIPLTIIGEPFYNFKNCIFYLIDQLTNNGYTAEFTEPNYIYIDWRKIPKDDKYNKLKNVLASKFPGAEIEFV